MLKAKQKCVSEYRCDEDQLFSVMRRTKLTVGAQLARPLNVSKLMQMQQLPS
jgi:hypothetical protein